MPDSNLTCRSGNVRVSVRWPPTATTTIEPKLVNPLTDGGGSGAIVALRSRRLEGFFGARLDAVSYAQVVALTTNGVSESYDLDFQGELYGGNDKAKRDLAGDMAALANTAGGVLLLGVAEDD
ncbi:AlbA family DNA-binding domain-containing protein [Streptomyces mirabilis]|uniref:AlbA family DNA-binding domain-containing protein n=1 Tax=Streptomyces mirabilis TaxID=68239 RepID=UPI0036BF176B